MGIGEEKLMESFIMKQLHFIKKILIKSDSVSWFKGFF